MIELPCGKRVALVSKGVPARGGLGLSASVVNRGHGGGDILQHDFCVEIENVGRADLSLASDEGKEYGADAVCVFPGNIVVIHMQPGQALYALSDQGTEIDVSWGAGNNHLWSALEYDRIFGITRIEESDAPKRKLLDP